MLDIKIIRENPEFVKEKLKLRSEDSAIIDRILEIDSTRLDIIKKSEQLKELRNKVSDEIGVMKKNKQNADEKIAEMKKVSDEVKKLDDELRECESRLTSELYYIPNLPGDDTPAGASADDNVEKLVCGEKLNFDFKVKDHVELGKMLDIIDFERFKSCLLK